MKRLLTFAAAALLAMPIVAAAGQAHGGGGGGSHGGGGGGGHAAGGGGGGHASAPAAPSGGGSVSSSGAASGGSTAGSSGGRSGGRAEGAARPAGSWRSGATGGSGTVMPRAAGRTTSENGATGSQEAVPRHSRPSDGAPTTGTAVPRGPNNPRPGTTTPTYVIPYYGGYGFYDPWLLGGMYGGAFYGSYYGGYYDPWFGGGYVPQTTYSSNPDEGSLRLKIKPKNAEVYVDGYYVGVVDDFDGIFQRLHIDSGTHRVEVRADGYETLTFDVRVAPDHTTTYQGELKRLP